MNIVFDASCAINLVIGDQLSNILQLPEHTFSIGPIVLSECEQQSAELDAAVEAGLITLLSDDDISGSVFLALLNEFGLGEGETECLTICKLTDMHLACDDLKARNAAKVIIGLDRVVGTLSLLKRCVEHQIISSDRAVESVGLMKARGSFLPGVASDYFSN